MTSIERLKQVKQVIGHKSCPDGTAAAMICARALTELGVDFRVKFVQYDTKEHLELEARPGQLFVDITPPVSRWKDWIGHDPIVLDHHDTAEIATVGLRGVYGYPEESGATLAFKHVMQPVRAALAKKPPGESVRHGSQYGEWERFAHLARIRDTWQEKHPDFETGCGLSHGVMFYGSFDLVDAAREDRVNFEKIQAVGSDVYRKLMWKAKLYAETAHRFEVKKGGRTYRVGVFNCSEKATSEAAHILLNDHGCDVAAGYFMLVEDGGVCLSVSLRSHKTGGVLVNKIAEKYGGGGHPPAAGFRIADALRRSLQDICDAISDALPE